MKKNFRKLLISALALSSTVCLLAGCDALAIFGGEKLDAVKDYEWTYNPEFQDPCDEDMTIDGSLDEARWKNQTWLTHTDGDVTVQYTTVFSEKGLYIGAIANDEDIQWNSRLNMGYYNSYLGDGVMNADNSTFWFRISAKDEKDYHTFTAYNFFIDAKDRASRNQTRFQAKASLNDELGKADEMTAELFVTWEALNMEIPIGEEFPQSVRICPAYRYVKEENNGENKWVLPSFYTLNAYRMRNNGVFTADGYGNPDVENAVLGETGNGKSKSDGWDLSELNAETPKVTTTWAHDQAIFFTDIQSDTYLYSTKVKLLPETWGEGNGGAGLIDLVSPSEFISLYVYANHLSSDNAGNRNEVWIGLYGNLRDLGSTNSRYNDKLCLTFPFEERYETEGIELTVAKNGSMIYYFAERQLVYAGNFNMLQSNASPGLYTLTRQAEFTDFYAEDYSDDPNGLLEKINEYAYTVTTESSGGAVTPEKLAVALDESGNVTEDFVFRLDPVSGYVLTTLEIEGTSEDCDYYQYAVENLEDGVLTIDKSKITGNLSVKAKFTTYRTGENMNSAVKVTGKVTSATDGSNVNGATVRLKGDNPLMNYETTVNNGTYMFYALPAGTYTVKDKDNTRTVNVNGHYAFEVEMYGYKFVTDEVTIPALQDGVEKQDVAVNFVVEERVIGGNVNIEGVIVESDHTYWTPDKYLEDVVTIKSGGNCSHFYYTGVATESAVIEFTVTNLSDTSKTYDKAPSVGVRMENSALKRFEVGFTINNTAQYSRTGAWEAMQQFQYDKSYADFDLMEIGVAHTFRIVRSGAAIATFVKQGEEWVELFNVSDPIFAGVRAYALTYRDGGGEKTIEFSDCKIAYQSADTVDGVPFDEFIKNTFTREIQIADFDESLGSIEIINGAEKIDGKYYAYAGEEITVAVKSDKKYKIFMGDQSQNGNGDSQYVFMVKNDCEIGLYPTNLMKQDATTGEIVYAGPNGGTSASQYYYLGSGNRVYLNTTIKTDAVSGVNGTEGIIIKVGEQERRVLFAGSGVYIFTEKDGGHNNSIKGAAAYINSGLTTLDGEYAIYQSLVTFGKYFDTDVSQSSAMETPYGTWYGNGKKYSMGDITACNNVTYLIENGYLYISLGETAETATAYLKINLRCLFGVDTIDQNTEYTIGYASSGGSYINMNYANGVVESPAYSYTTNVLLFDDEAYDAAEENLEKFGEKVPHYEQNLDDGVWIDGSKFWDTNA